MTIRLSTSKVLYFISAVFLVTDRFFGVNTSASIRYIIGIVWCLYFLLNIFWKGKVRIDPHIFKHLKLIGYMYIAIFAYTLLLWLFRTDIAINNLTRLCSTIIYTFIYIGFACAGYWLFKRQVIDIILWAAVFSYAVGSVGYLIISSGLSEVIQYIKALVLGATDGTGYSYAMEVHGLTFMSGILFLYYCFFEEKGSEHHSLKIILSALLVFLGLKRIEILAIVIAVLAYYVALRGGRHVRFRAGLFTVVSIVASSLFIYVIESGALVSFTTLYGIDTSGRLSYWNYASRYFEYSIDYIGSGFTYFSRLFQQLYLSGLRIDGAGVPSSIHSDLLVMYIEIGFIPFYIWIVYNFYIRTNYLDKRSSPKVAECYLLLTIFMFILYLTDNTLTYYSVQMMYFLAPLVLEDEIGLKKLYKNEG